jgi:hypothetical protein
MPVFKKQLTPIGKAGKIVKHVGKGATEQNLPGTAQGGFSSNMNDYSQATPLANPISAPDPSQSPSFP